MFGTGLAARYVPAEVRSIVDHVITTARATPRALIPARLKILREFKRGPHPSLEVVTTQLCSKHQFDGPTFHRIGRRFDDADRYHRKTWEHVFIAAALEQAGCLDRGKRGITFGCGLEPLPSYFAARNCRILATDAPDDVFQASAWIETNQHAAGAASLYQPHLVDRETFDRNVGFRIADMNHIPYDLTGFDFCWSACALEHLGSRRHGIDFMLNAMRCLKPGGIAVHTTEFNLSSLQQTIDEPAICFYLKRDIEAFIDECVALGHEVSAPNWRCVSTRMDRLVDEAPYRNERHLKLVAAGHIITSIGIILRKKR